LSARTRALSETALRRVDNRPRQAMALATDALRQAIAEGDHESAAICERARGLAALHLSHLDTAVTALRAAIGWARRAGRPVLTAEARMSLAFVLTRRGALGPALRAIQLACAGLTGVPGARALAQRAAILQQLGRLDEALVDYRAALPGVRAAADWVWVWRILNNRGVLHLFRYNFGAALADLHEAEQLCQREGLDLLHANVHENLGFANSRKGDVPTALHHFAEAERRYRALGVGVGSLLVDRGELLMSVRLSAEARDAAARALDEFARTGRRISMPEGQLLLARAALMDGDPDGAQPAAAQAARAFRRQGREDWAALARLLVLRCRIATGDPTGVGVAQFGRIADVLDAAGWRQPAMAARILAARLAIERGHPARARELLVHAAAARTRGPAELRVGAWHAEALLRLATGDRRGAVAAVAAGLRIVDQHRASLGATDLRAYVSGHGTDLGQLGLRLAVESNSARRVFGWAERIRAAHLMLPPVAPPDDRRLAGYLAQLRAVTSELAGALRTGRPAPTQQRRRAALERVIRDHTRNRRGSPTDQPPVPAVEALRAALGPAVLLEFLDVGGELYVITIGSPGVRLRHLATTTDITQLLRHLPFALNRIARSGGSASGLAAAQVVTSIAGRLDDLLTARVLPEVGDAPLVIVPTGPLQSVPWALLPSCAHRPVTVAPSASLWYRARQRPARVGPLLAAAGPDLPSASAEVRAVGALYPDPLVYTGASATAPTVLAALPRAGIAHIAAHGTFRADNPLFSALRLADGPLTVYDVQALPQVPEVVILASCDSGLSLACPGDELLGLASAFLTIGSRTLIGTVAPVPDTDAASMMQAVHRGLRRGLSPAAALVAARTGLDASTEAERIVASTFVCLGDGLYPGGSPAVSAPAVSAPTVAAAVVPAPPAPPISVVTPRRKAAGSIA
jgi:tetratricopeptide (TPR) repeat protein